MSDPIAMVELYIMHEYLETPHPTIDHFEFSRRVSLNSQLVAKNVSRHMPFSFPFVEYSSIHIILMVVRLKGKYHIMVKQEVLSGS